MPALGTLGADVEVAPSSTAGATRTSTTRTRARSSTRSRSRRRWTSASRSASAICRSTSSPPTRPRTWPTVVLLGRHPGAAATAARRGSRRWAPGSMTRATTSGASSSSRPHGERLIAGSDRDYGLVILRYTGPGAIGPGGVRPDPAPRDRPGAPSNRVRLRLGALPQRPLDADRQGQRARPSAGRPAGQPAARGRGPGGAARTWLEAGQARRAGAAHAQGAEGEAAPAGPGAAGGGPRRRHGHAQMDADGRHNTPRQPPARDREVVVGSSTLGTAQGGTAVRRAAPRRGNGGERRGSAGLAPAGGGRAAHEGGGAAAAAAAASAPSHHGPTAGHLPPRAQEMELVGRLEPKAAFGDIVPGQIADLTVHKGFAYLNSWDSADCTRGGTHVVDIRNPAAPAEVGFIPAPADYYHGEGAHAISIDTPAFQGDILAVNDETYGSNILGACSDPLDQTFGGFDLYDVSNRPTRSRSCRARATTTATRRRAARRANSYHSVFAGRTGRGPSWWPRTTSSSPTSTSSTSPTPATPSSSPTSTRWRPSRRSSTARRPTAGWCSTTTWWSSASARGW